MELALSATEMQKAILCEVDRDKAFLGTSKNVIWGCMEFEAK